MSQPSLTLTVLKNVLDVRASPDSSTELHTQYVMGAKVAPGELRGKWRRVTGWDGCEGWCTDAWVVTSREQVGTEMVVETLIADVLAAPGDFCAIMTKVVIGTCVAVCGFAGDWARVAMPDGREGWLRSSELAELDLIAHTYEGERVVGLAKRLIGVPYLWGGTTPFGLDCSGLVQLVHRLLGVRLPRNSSVQAEDSRFRSVSLGDGLVPGDLLFFSQPGERISHVGLSIGGTRFIHSRGDDGVTCAGLDDPPWRSILRCARRLE